MKMEQVQKKLLIDFLQQTVSPGETLLAAVSGGADSMALLDLLLCCQKTCGYQVAVAHVHHHLRAASDAEWQFVMQYCAQRAVPFYGRHVQVVDGKKNGESLEAAAHRLRHQALRNMMQASGAQWLILAHQADDRAETVLMNILRGCGVNGLAAMPSREGHLLRPLLPFSKAALENYCAEHDIPYVSDESNADTTILRNRLRHELLPILTAYNPQIGTALNHLAENSEQVAAYVQKQAAQLYEEACALAAPQWVLLHRKPLLNAHDAVVSELVRSLSQRLAGNRGSLRFEMMSAVSERLRAGDGRCDLGQGFFCECTRRWVYIGRWPQGEWIDNKGCWQQHFLCAEVGVPEEMVVRPYQSGDVIAVKNLGRKQLKKIFQEAALPPCLRSIWPVVYDTKIKEIIWVPFLAQSPQLMYYNSVTYLKVALYCKIAQQDVRLEIDRICKDK
ncbi:MAG: tRNA lysidine(34) synthetase TilS [Peptococcaceae bacterium]|nr:tRNA lysidine(34) synthetase TilS [Peptococcaceae bacterium]